jgi:hypothetical protein
MMFLILCALVASFYPLQVVAQFGNFFQGGFPFGGFQHQQHHDQTPQRQHKGWTEFENGTPGHDLAEVSSLSSGLRMSGIFGLCAYAS